MIMALKEFVLRPNGDTIAPGELSGFVVNGTRMYALYLRIYYLISGRAALSGPGLDQLTLAIYDFFSLLEGAVEAKATKKIEYLQIDRLIDEIYRYELVNWPIRATTLKSLVRIALERVFADPSRRAYGDRPSRVTGLDQGVLVAFKDGLLGWIGMQGLWRDLTTKAAAQVPQLVNTDGSIKPIPMKTIREIWPTLSTPHKRPFEEIAQLFLRSLPLSYSDQDAIVFQSDVSKIVLSQDGFNSLNWKTALARIIAMGFSADPEANRFKGVSRAEFKVFFDVARELAIDFKFVDPADNQIWNSSFTELNLFALSADADEWLSFSEGMDFISYAFSAATMVVKTKDDLKVNCPHLAPDVFGEPTFSAQCFRRQMAKNFPLFYADLPRWARLATNLQSRGTYSDLQWLLESAGRTNGFSSAPIASSDLTRMSMVLHYVEGLFTRFDDNRSGSITLAEARDVYPLFREILKKASGMDDDEKVFAVFTYILQFGRPPETLTEKLYFQFVWKDQPERWTFKADRMQMLNIIASLKAAVS
jgi:hypothetical protein